MNRAILAALCLALAATPLNGCCDVMGCSGSLDIVFSEAAVALGDAEWEIGGAPWYTVEMSFGDSARSYACDDGWLRAFAEYPPLDGGLSFGLCSPLGFQLSVDGEAAPKSIAISVHAARWSKSFDRLDAAHTKFYYPNGKHCDGKCRSSSFTL